jgi:hypothetical protein
VGTVGRQCLPRDVKTGVPGEESGTIFVGGRKVERTHTFGNLCAHFVTSLYSGVRNLVAVGCEGQRSSVQCLT